MTPVELLAAAPGIENYPELFPRLKARHPHALEPTGRATAAALARAGRAGPCDPDTAATRYSEAGELDALLCLDTGRDLVTAATAKWQKELTDKLAKAEERARLCDRERVVPADGSTWLQRFGHLRERLAGDAAGWPGAILLLVSDYEAQMRAALGAAKFKLRAKLTELGARGRALAPDAGVTKRADELTARAARQIDADDLFGAAKRLEELEDLLRTQNPVADAPAGRLPLPARTNPPGAKFHFSKLVRAALYGRDVVQKNGFGLFLPTEGALAEAADADEFLALHAGTKWTNADAYDLLFRALFRWLGLDRTAVRARLPMAHLEPKGHQLPGRWTFLETLPWQGAPFYDDPDGTPRVLAVVRLGVTENDRTNPHVVFDAVRRTLESLWASEPSTPAEQRFRQDGLVLVLLPGDLLSARTYAQSMRDVRVPPGCRADRLALADDLDLLRVLPVPPEKRFRALLELILPRFTAALGTTFRNTSAVRPRMFYGRTDELAKLEANTTVVFSGRRMGKSSLLARLQSQCAPPSNQRAVQVSCATLAAGRSWQVLVDIERELVGLVHREEGAPGAPPAVPPVAPTADPRADAQRAIDRFRAALADAMKRLEVCGVRRLYVLLDEADNFVRSETEEHSGRRTRAAVSWALRELETATYDRRVRFIFAGYDQLGRIFHDPGLGESAFGNWGGKLPLEVLDEPDARALVVEPLAALGMPVGDDIANRILDYTSRHASLIQAFAERLAAHVHQQEKDWPLNDCPVRFEHLTAIADDERGDGNYRQQLEQTLGLNLDIARAYPLRFVFLALVTPGGAGRGHILGADPFEPSHAFDQVRPPEDGAPELPAELVSMSLVLLAQLGLLEGAGTGRAYRFRAWHYVTVLRTRNGLRAELEKARADWFAGERRGSGEPRCVWTLPDTDLHALRHRDGARASVLVGLPGSGREYAADLLASPLEDGAAVPLFRADDPQFAARAAAWLAEGGGPAVVCDPADAVPWTECRALLRAALTADKPLRWVGGPHRAWELAGDEELSAELGGVYGFGPLTAAELEPWTARRLGTDDPGTQATVHPPDAACVLRETGGLLPVLEQFREWLLNKHGAVPEPLTARHAELFRRALHDGPKLLARVVEALRRQVPHELREGLHALFRAAAEYDRDEDATADWLEASEDLKARGPAFVARVLDAGGWLGFVSPCGSGRWRVPYGSALGLIVRDPKFATP